MVSFIKTTNEVTSNNLANFMVKFIRALFIGIVCAIPIYFLNYKKMLGFSKYFYLFAILINIYTLFFGVQLNGIKYFRFAGISVLASVSAYTFICSFFCRKFKRRTKREKH